VKHLNILVGGALLTVTLQPWPAGAMAVEPVTVTNSVGMEFVLIPKGSFQMGSADTEREAQPNERPRHAVTSSRPFYLARYEVTQAQWEVVMGTSAYTLSRSNPYYSMPGMAERVRRPSNPVTVSWNDAQVFIQKLNEREGHGSYRLPTEAEWEYAARAGTTTAYSFGDDAGLLSRYAWHGEDFATGSMHPVGQKLPNSWGLYDMHGNVWEWVQDWYADRYPGSAPTTDPAGPDTGTSKVVRGGSWHVTAGSWRSAVRKPYEPDYRGISIGFRVARDLE
jgi:formylglycine-generating enzyme required for sulfatase activity